MFINYDMSLINFDRSEIKCNKQRCQHLFIFLSVCWLSANSIFILQIIYWPGLSYIFIEIEKFQKNYFTIVVDVMLEDPKRTTGSAGRLRASVQMWLNDVAI
jgi:hypothetical protein